METNKMLDRTIPGARRAFLSGTARSLTLALLVALPTTALLTACGGGGGGGINRDDRWLSSWTASHNVPENVAGISNSTVRMFVRPTASGNRVRVKLENTVGTAPVTFSGAYIGTAATTTASAAVATGSTVRLTFDGKDDLTLAPGAVVWSDSARIDATAFQRMVVSLNVASASSVSTHTLGLTTNYIAPGSRASDESATGFVPVEPIAQGTAVLAFPFYWISAVDVRSDQPSTVVTFGDSITDGRCSTTTNGGINNGGVVVPDLYQRWTDVLAQRLAALPPEQRRAVANAGIAGNRIVTAGGNGPLAVDRLDRDVLGLSGVSHVVFFEGTNDIAGGATSAAVIQGMQGVVDRIHAKSIKVIVATMMPRGRNGAGFTSLQEQYRLEVNDWIRTQAKIEGIIDFDAVTKGGGKSDTGAEIIRTDFNCDYIHPNAAGYAAMGQAIDLNLFK